MFGMSHAILSFVFFNCYTPLLLALIFAVYFIYLRIFEFTCDILILFANSPIYLRFPHKQQTAERSSHSSRNFHVKKHSQTDYYTDPHKTHRAQAMSHDPPSL